MESSQLVSELVKKHIQDTAINRSKEEKKKSRGHCDMISNDVLL